MPILCLLFWTQLRYAYFFEWVVELLSEIENHEVLFLKAGNDLKPLAPEDLDAETAETLKQLEEVKTNQDKKMNEEVTGVNQANAAAKKEMYKFDKVWLDDTIITHSPKFEIVDNLHEVAVYVFLSEASFYFSPAMSQPAEQPDFGI